MGVFFQTFFFVVLIVGVDLVFDGASSKGVESRKEIDGVVYLCRSERKIGHILRRLAFTAFEVVIGVGGS